MNILDIFEGSSDIKFHKNPSSVSRVVLRGQKTETVVTFRNLPTAWEE